MGPKNVPDEDELYKIIGRIYYHTFPLYNLDTTPIGFAIHLVPQLKHSCTPNTVFAYTGSTLCITALQDLPELDWNNVSIAIFSILSFKIKKKIICSIFKIHCN